MLKCETVITGNIAFFKQYEDILNIEIKTDANMHICVNNKCRRYANDYLSEYIW